MKRLATLIFVLLAAPWAAFAQWRALGPFGGDVQDVNISPVNSSVMLAGVAPGLAFPRPDLRIARSGSTVVLSWMNSTYTLQAAPSPTGAYTNIPGATSPYRTRS